MQKMNLSLHKLLPGPSLTDMALSVIKDAILSKKLKPEVMYTEASLTNELGISRTPVREALIHLASRGMIVYFPRKGFEIKSLTVTDIANLFELRLTLELTVIKHIIPNLTEKSLNKLEGVRIEYIEVMEKGGAVESIRANRDFHMFLAELTENTYLIRSLDEIRDLTDLANAKSLELNIRNHEAIAEHEKIITEIKKRSINGALKQMEAHILTTKERVLTMIQSSKTIDSKEKEYDSREYAIV